MVSKGHIKEAEINSFNLPFYTPYKDKVKDIIDKEGGLETFEVNWDPRDNDMTEFHDSAKMLAKTIRAVTEPLLISHFGNFRIDDLSERYAEHVAEHLSKEKTKYFNIVVSLTKNKQRSRSVYACAVLQAFFYALYKSIDASLFRYVGFISTS
ncbi:hypothetical protein RJ640_001563 [Escallonia rubra]|uniref:Uncharacterized protein n=1 Tax=Escallonia rubra TaxID=112253 RepID=A0AA88QCR6_9ASTE|nr:hypothetical protein RJ640_001563 [Escallonia rubra]